MKRKASAMVSDVVWASTDKEGKHVIEFDRQWVELHPKKSGYLTTVVEQMRAYGDINTTLVLQVPNALLSDLTTDMELWRHFAEDSRMSCVGLCGEMENLEALLKISCALDSKEVRVMECITRCLQDHIYLPFVRMKVKREMLQVALSKDGKLCQATQTKLMHVLEMTHQLELKKKDEISYHCLTALRMTCQPGEDIYKALAPEYLQSMLRYQDVIAHSHSQCTIGDIVLRREDDNQAPQPLLVMDMYTEIEELKSDVVRVQLLRSKSLEPLANPISHVYFYHLEFAVSNNLLRAATREQLQAIRTETSKLDDVTQRLLQD